MPSKSTLFLIILSTTSHLQNIWAAGNKYLPTTSYAKASFIPPAAPSSVGWPSTASPQRVMDRIATGYGTYHPDRTVHLAKKNGGGGSSSGSGGGTSAKIKPVSKNGKIQVVLLKPVQELGQTGDVVFVSSAIFQNTLKRSGKARLISEDEVAKLEQEKEEAQKEMIETALKTKQMIEEAAQQCKDGTDAALIISRKAGPDGNLFARVNPKIIIESLKESFPDGAFDGKQVKLVKVKDSEGGDVKRMDVKNVGLYTVDLSLEKGVDVTFGMSIVAE
eukprot:scaffold27272_cov71-Cyclotella_meneghiniana.AAC.4